MTSLDSGVDFRIAPPLAELIEKVRLFVEDDVAPTEREVADPTDLLGSWAIVESLRDRARDLSLFAPHLPPEWGGLGTAVRDGDGWVLDGRKWFITGAEGAASAIVVARTSGLDGAVGRDDYSLFLVPAETPGWEVVRDPEIIGAHFVGGHPEVRLNEVRLRSAELPHRQEVAMVKTFVSEALGRILDRAVQVFGSHGMATDEPIARWYADARAARIYDGASEVHRMVIARRLLRLAEAGGSTRTGCGAEVG